MPMPGVSEEEEEQKQAMSLVERALTDLDDDELILGPRQAELEVLMATAVGNGGGRHATICIAERALLVTRRKKEMLMDLAEGRRLFEANRDIPAFRNLVNQIAHPEVPTSIKHGLHPRHCRVLAAREAIDAEMERRAQQALEVAKKTKSCDEIERLIDECLALGHTREHPALTEAWEQANTLRESERLEQRKTISLMRQVSLKSQAVSALSGGTALRPTKSGPG